MFHVDPWEKNGNTRNGTESGRRPSRTGRMRAHHSWRSRVAESVRVRTGDSGPSADPPGSTSRRSASEKARQSRARRQGSSSAFVSSVRQATGKTKLKMPLVSLSSVRVLSLSFSSLSVSLARERLFLAVILDRERYLARSHFSRDLPVENHFPDSVIERRAIVKRGEDATVRPRDFRGKSWVRFLWLVRDTRNGSF